MLLERAGIPPRYVLVAESLAAFDARVYTGFYPEEVAGVVLVDGSHPDLLTRVPRVRGKVAPVQKYIGYPENIASRAFNEVGLLGLMSGTHPAPRPRPPGITEEEWATIWRMTNEPRARVAFLEELPAVEESIAQVRAAGDLGDRPLRVLSKAVEGPDEKILMELQADLVRLSTRGRQVLMGQTQPGPLYYEAPAGVAEAVRQVAQEVRR